MTPKSWCNGKKKGCGQNNRRISCAIVSSPSCSARPTHLLWLRHCKKWQYIKSYCSPKSQPFQNTFRTSKCHEKKATASATPSSSSQCTLSVIRGSNDMTEKEEMDRTNWSCYLLHCQRCCPYQNCGEIWFQETSEEVWQPIWSRKYFSQSSAKSIYVCQREVNERPFKCEVLFCHYWPMV